jgi:hypothetical protein
MVRRIDTLQAALDESCRQNSATDPDLAFQATHFGSHEPTNQGRMRKGFVIYIYLLSVAGPVTPSAIRDCFLLVEVMFSRRAHQLPMVAG